MENNYYNANPMGYATASQAESAASLQSYVAKVMRRVYGKMFLGLLITAITSLATISSETLLSIIFSSNVTFFGLMIAELVLVFVISGAINKLSSTTATLLFFLYAIINGVTMSVIFLAYSPSAITLAFTTTALTFGTMSFMGYVTKMDLSKVGSILYMALIGLIIASVVNIFLASSAMDWFISIAGVVLFTGLTAWDTQKIKNMASMTDPSMVGKLATIGALSLYLDFINLFIYLLRLFGGSRN